MGEELVVVVPDSIISSSTASILVFTRGNILEAARETDPNSIRFYTGNYCPYCRGVKKELDRLGLVYESINADADGRAEVIELSGQRAIPILTIGDEVLVDSAHIIRELRRRYA